jgi:hypothetical protein
LLKYFTDMVVKSIVLFKETNETLFAKFPVY